jgi:hypothetical protein
MPHQRPPKSAACRCCDGCRFKKGCWNKDCAALASRSCGLARTPQERVAVVEHGSGRVLAGAAAPSKKRLRAWLEVHPDWHVLEAAERLALRRPRPRRRPRLHAVDEGALFTRREEIEVALRAPI